MPLPMQQAAGFQTAEAMAQAYAGALGRQPWLAYFPAILDLIPLPEGWAADPENKMVALQTSVQTNWKLIAIAGGRPLRIFGEWDGKSFRPIAFWETPQIFRILQD